MPEVVLVCLISFGIPLGILCGVYSFSSLAGLVLKPSGAISFGGKIAEDREHAGL